MRSSVAVILAVLLSGTVFAQTTINGSRTILGDWDASGANTTIACKTGTSVPGTCTVGECFFDTDASAGSNLFGCTSTDNWSLLGGAGGSGAFSDAGDPIVQNTTTKVVHVGDGAGTLAGKFEIGGDADEPQMVVEGHSSQTDSLAVFQNDADTELLSVSPTGSIFITEKAEADADVASHGQIWVDTASPNTLFFTNDAGTDVQLGVGGAPPVKTIQFSASALEATASSAADAVAPLAKDTGTNADVFVRLFDDTTDECVGGVFNVPSDITTTGADVVTFRVRWYSGTATTNDAMLDFKWGEVGDNETWDGALTTEESGAVTTAGTVDLITMDTWTETITNLGWAANDLIIFELCRDADSTGTGTDNLVGDLALIDFAVTMIRE